MSRIYQSIKEGHPISIKELLFFVVSKDWFCAQMLRNHLCLKLCLRDSVHALYILICTYVYYVYLKFLVLFYIYNIYLQLYLFSLKLMFSVGFSEDFYS